VYYKSTEMFLRIWDPVSGAVCGVRTPDLTRTGNGTGRKNLSIIRSFFQGFGNILVQAGDGAPQVLV
jgi:hypothetical protein